MSSAQKKAQNIQWFLYCGKHIVQKQGREKRYPGITKQIDSIQRIYLQQNEVHEAAQTFRKRLFILFRFYHTVLLVYQDIQVLEQSFSLDFVSFLITQHFSINIDTNRKKSCPEEFHSQIISLNLMKYIVCHTYAFIDFR